MRPAINGLLILSLLFAASCNCMYKKDCAEPYLVQDGTYFNNFSGEELDSMQITMYAINSGFTNPYDSVTILKEELDSLEANRFKLRYTPSPNADTKIFLPRLYRTYKINNFRWKEVTCKKCAFKKETNREPDGFDINGQYQAGFSVNIYK